MGLLDFDDEKILAGRKLPANDHNRRPYDNFEELQMLNRKENSPDFSDSPFADRADEQEYA